MRRQKHRDLAPLTIQIAHQFARQIDHPQPERAVELAVYFAAAACRDRILFSEAPHAAATGGDDAELLDELERMVLGYLGVRPSPRPRDRT